MGSVASSRHQVPWFHPELMYLGGFGTQIYSNNNLPLGVNECVSWDKFCIYHNLDQEKVFTKDRWWMMNKYVSSIFNSLEDSFI